MAVKIAAFFLGYYWRNEYEHQCLALTRAMWAIRSRTRLLSKRTKSMHS